MAKRCEHEWEPLVKINTYGLSRNIGFVIAFALQLQHLDGYDRCKKCNRISWIAKSRWRTRKLVSVDTTDLMKRASDFEKWADQQRVEETVG